MIIDSLELENIRSYKKEEIAFNEGINFLSGDIGSGKSTILLSIEFALLGFKRGDLEGYHLLRKGEREGSVKLILKDLKNNINIEIFRKIKKGKSNDTISQENGYLKVDDSLIELSPQELNSHVFEILNFPKEFISKDKNLVYRFTTYTPQEQLKEILYSEPEKRLEVIRKLFKIDKYKQLKGVSQIYTTKIRSDKKLLEGKLLNRNNVEKESEEVNEVLKKLKESFEKLKPNEVKIKEVLQKIKEKKEKKEESLSLIREKKILIEKNLSKIEEIRESNKELILEIKKNKDKLSELKSKNVEDTKKTLEKEKNELLENIKDLESKKKDKNIELKEIDEKLKSKDIISQKKLKLDSNLELIKQLEKGFDYILTKCKLKDLEKEIKDLEKDKKNLEKEQEKLDSEKKAILELEFKVKSIEESLSKLNKENSSIEHMKNCNLCHQEVSESHKSLLKEDFRKKREELELELESTKEKLDVKIGKVDVLINKFENLNQKVEDLKIKESKLEQLKEQEVTEKEKYEELKKLKLEVSNIQKENIDENLKQFDKILEEKDKIGVGIENLKNEELKLREKIQKIELDFLKISNLQKEIETKGLEIKRKDERIKSNEEKLEKHNDLEEKLEIAKKREIEFLQNLKEIEVKRDEYLEKEKLLLNKLTSLETQIKDKEERKKVLDKNIGDIKKDEVNFEKLVSNENFFVNVLNSILDSIEQALFTKYYVEFNEAFEMYFRDLIEDNEIDVRLDDQFSPVIEQNGYDIDIKNLSGGEKSSLAVAYRLSLKKIIESNLNNETKLSLMILDEPTDGFSDEQVIRLGSILKESELKQILLVSHDEKVESIANNIIKVEKTNHISSVTY